MIGSKFATNYYGVRTHIELDFILFTVNFLLNGQMDGPGNYFILCT